MEEEDIFLPRAKRRKGLSRSQIREGLDFYAFSSGEENDFLDECESEEGDSDSESEHDDLTPKDQLFVWSDAGDFEPKVHPFEDIKCGVHVDSGLDPDSPILDYFLLFFDERLVKKIVASTNDNYKSSRGSRKVSPRSRDLQWKDTNVEEIYVFLGLIMLMPLAKKHSIMDYWKKSSLTHIPVFSRYMPRDRFLLLFRFLSFACSTTEDDTDPLSKIIPVYQDLKAKFQKYFVPYQNLLVDNSQILFKGRLSFNRYKYNERLDQRSGVKVYILCDCKTRIVLDIMLCTGSTEVPPTDALGFAGLVVKKLIGQHLNKGYILYTDYEFTSPALCHFLHTHGTGSCGSADDSRRHMPKFPAGLRDGDCFRVHSENVLALRFHDKHDVSMLSTVHRGELRETDKLGKKVKRPDAMIDYIVNTRLPVNNAMEIGNVECMRKSIMWYKKLFLHLLDITIHNAYKYYIQKTSSKLLLKDFCNDLVTQILEKYGHVVSSHRGNRYPTASFGLDRLAAKDYLARHYLLRVPPSPNDLSRGRVGGQRRCRVCAETVLRQKNLRKLTTWMCAGCDTPLCPGDCFRDYHTLSQY